MVAAAGAGPCAQSTVAGVPGPAKISGRSPPGPLRCGSTTCSVKPAATAASNALPPASSRAMPAADASQCVDDTMPKEPRSSGRVVNTIRTLRAARSADDDHVQPAGAVHALDPVQFD